MKSKKEEREFYFCFDMLSLAGTVTLAVIIISSAVTFFIKEDTTQLNSIMYHVLNHRQVIKIFFSFTFISY